MKNLLTVLLTVLCLGVTAYAQVQLPRTSPRAEIAQTVGDTKIAIVYHRPSMKNRKVFGDGKDFLVPYGQVWRTGANENTTFEISENVKINGQDLPAGKYGLHTIPGKDEWVVIFNKVNNEWGSFNYKESEDALRIKVKPEKTSRPYETMLLDFDTVTPTTTAVMLKWDTVRLPFTVDIGDMNSRVLAKVRKAVADSKPDNAQVFVGSRMTGANFILDNKIKSAYPEAATWIDDALKAREAFGTLRAKARISAETGNYKDAVTYGEKAITIGKAAQPPINVEFMANFEKDVAGWKTKN